MLKNHPNSNHILLELLAMLQTNPRYQKLHNLFAKIYLNEKVRAQLLTHVLEKGTEHFMRYLSS